MNYIKYAFPILIIVVFSNCKYDVEIQDSPRLLKKVSNYNNFQFDVNTVFSKFYKWNHFKLENDKLLFDSIPDRFQFEEKNTEKIKLFKDFTTRIPIKLIEKGGNDIVHCVYFIWPGSISGDISKDSTKHTWSLDPSTYCNDAEYAPFINEFYALFDKMNK